MARGTQQLTTRDLDVVLTALDYGPMTARQLCRFSATYPQPFRSEIKVRARMRMLQRAGLVRCWPYSLPGLGGCYYYTLTWQGYRLRFGPDARPATSWHLNQLSLTRQPHTYALMEFLTHTFVSAHRAGIQLTGFARENSVPLTACGQTHYFDCAFQLVVPGVLDYRFFVEIDNHTEPLISATEAESLQRKLTLYEHLQDRFGGRFRVLLVCTRRGPRLDHLLALAAQVSRRPQRSLFLGASLPEYLARVDAVAGPHFRDHRGQAVPLVWLPERRYRLLAALQEHPLTQRQLLRYSRRGPRLFTTQERLGADLHQLIQAGWVQCRQHQRSRQTVATFGLTPLGREHLPQSAGGVATRSPVFYSAPPV